MHSWRKGLYRRQTTKAARGHCSAAGGSGHTSDRSLVTVEKSWSSNPGEACSVEMGSRATAGDEASRTVVTDTITAVDGDCELFAKEDRMLEAKKLESEGCREACERKAEATCLCQPCKCAFIGLFCCGTR